MEHWYLLQTKSRQEQVAEENLQRQAFRTLSPKMRRPHRRRGRWQDVVAPMFPGYLFIRLDLAAQNSAPIRSTRGVIGLVRFGAQPTPVPRSVIEGLHAAAGQRDGMEISSPFEPGQPVTIVGGGFAGLDAIFQSESGEERVILLLDLLGRQNRVTVSRHQVVPT